MLKYSHEYGKNLTYYNVGCLCSVLWFMGAIRGNGSVPLSPHCKLRNQSRISTQKPTQPNPTSFKRKARTLSVTQELSCTAGSPNLRLVSI